MLSSIFTSFFPILLIVLFFGGTIFVHELGHFLAARRRGLVVERFSIGFGPKLFGWTRDGVDYRVSLLPLGGYVALPQLAEMGSVEGETQSDHEKLPPISYSSKVIVAVMGAVFNVIFAFVLAFGVWIFGMPTSEAGQSTSVGFVVPEFVHTDGESRPSPAARAELQPTDRVLAIDGRSVRKWTDIPQHLVTGTGRDREGRPMAIFTIERDGEVIEVPLYPELRGDQRIRQVGIAPAHTVVVGGLIRGFPASDAGVQRGDVLVEIDGNPIHSASHKYHYIGRNPDREMTFTFRRDEELYNVSLTPQPREIRRGEEPMPDVGLHITADRIIAYPNPVEQVTEIVAMTFRVLGALINPASDIGPRHLAGPPGIARFLHTASLEDWRLAVWVAVLINVNLAILNLLPIPVLDGGHIMFATIAKLRRKSLPPNFIIGVQNLFVLLLFTFIIYVSFHDIRDWVRDSAYERSYVEPDLVEEEEP